MELKSAITKPRERRDGWTSTRRERFLACLAAGSDVRRTCEAIGLSRQSVYRLRTRDAAFAEAWDDALCQARETATRAFLAGLPEFLLRTLSDASTPCHPRPPHALSGRSRLLYPLRIFPVAAEAALTDRTRQRRGSS